MDKQVSQENQTERRSLIFSISDKVGGLVEVLELFKSLKLNLSKIESRPSRTDKQDYDFFVDFDKGATSEQIEAAVQSLNSSGHKPKDITITQNKDQTKSNIRNVPWFPRKIADLDELGGKTLAYGEALDADHPGFTDSDYVKRRSEIASIAKRYKHGEKLPRIDYTPQEIETWKSVYNNLTALYPKYACKAQNYVFPLLVQNCGYGPDNIPQLEDVSKFLHDCTGWTLRPVTGLLSSRDFLNGFAFRVFHATQYIRHHSVPFYTPEPDVCHELLGHAPLFADPDFAEFSHEIGLASLGASDSDIERLATCYWFTVEYGLCKEDDKIKAYGAGLLSSFGELSYSVGEGEGDRPDKKKPSYIDFDPHQASNTKYPITEYQPTYFVASSFSSAKDKLKEFASTMDKPFSIRYNPYTQTVEILDNKDKLVSCAKEIQSQFATLSNAIAKLK